MGDLRRIQPPYVGSVTDAIPIAEQNTPIASFRFAVASPLSPYTVEQAVNLLTRLFSWLDRAVVRKRNATTSVLVFNLRLPLFWIEL